MHHKIVAVLFFVFSVLGFSQDSKAILTASIVVEADKYFGTDVLGYDYYSKNNVLYKHKNSEKKEYQNVFLGEIHSVDFINPLKVLVFYKGHNYAVLLDNQLSEIEKYSFSDLNIVANTCSMASQNRFWIYDGLTSKLLLFDYSSLKKTFVNQPFDSNFKRYSSDYNNWYRISEDAKLYRYNNYGKIDYLGDVPEFSNVLTIDSEKMLFTSGGNLYLYQVDKSTTELVFSIEKEVQAMNYRNGILTLFTGTTLEKYTLKTP